MSGSTRLCDGVIAVRVADEIVVSVQSTGALHLLDRTAAAVLAALLEGPTADLGQGVQADEAQVRLDTQRLLAQLVHASVLTHEL